MSTERVLRQLDEFFSEKVNRLGPSPQGVDYNSPEAQQTRFDQLMKLLPPPAEPFSLIDYGSGYGALAHYLLQKGYQFSYQGFDISEAMIQHALRQKPEGVDWRFFTREADLTPADYTIACGIFNMKFDADSEAWRAFILELLGKIARLSRKGFGFNMLTSYSDPDRMAQRPDLYFGDPLFFFDYCKRNFSRNVALLHDYNLYDWTILVRL
ncbi:MAG: class I SAM-dependent methyltransferase [Anaerolineales bacterium]|nr:class I SAM-dependent methyltransferase [Anaerolineales bacterium]MCX7755896.1 class I SAM-dependent methyltransferase [Anaerolineales bacterium]MDW8277940.1 class I SAM-dependent methyltransferase [Anaerolineales bacterium]